MAVVGWVLGERKEEGGLRIGVLCGWVMGRGFAGALRYGEEIRLVSSNCSSNVSAITLTETRCQSMIVWKRGSGYTRHATSS